MTTPRLGLDELIQNQSQPHVPINATIRLIDALLHLAVIDKDLTAPPGGESDGDTYIVGSGATGTWSGHDADIAYFQSTGYVFVNPRIGMWAYVDDEDARYQYTGNTGNGWELIDVGVGGGGGGAVELIASSVVSGSAVTSFGVSGLNLTAHERYIVEIELLSVSGAPTYALTYNADTTATNYDTQVFETANTTSAGARANNAVLLTSVTTDTTSIDGQIRIHVENQPRFIYEYSSGDAAAVKRGHGVHTWRTASTNVTGFKITASVATSIGVGSRIRVWAGPHS